MPNDPLNSPQYKKWSQILKTQSTSYFTYDEATTAYNDDVLNSLLAEAKAAKAKHAAEQEKRRVEMEASAKKSLLEHVAGEYKNKKPNGIQKKVMRTLERRSGGVEKAS